MKAAFLEAVGEPDVIRFGEIPTPEPSSGEVRVRVLAGSINPIDTYIRSGLVKVALPMPFVPGCDFAGVIDAVGPEVKSFRVGDRVWGSNQGLLGRQGTFAEFACVDEQWLYPSPDNVSDEQLAAAALVGITAHLGLFRYAKIQPGEMVFVNGGTGGVGMMVVQMAKIAGAKVIATVGSEEKRAIAHELGADLVINYKTEDVAAKVRESTAGKGIQIWFETQPPSDLDKTVDLTAANGRIVVMAGRAARPVFPNGPFYVKGLSLFGFAMFNMSSEIQRGCAEDIARWLVAGKLKPLVWQRFALHEVSAAHRLLEQNTANKSSSIIGKLVILPTNH